MGSIGPLSRPPVLNSPRHFSTELSLVGHGEPPEEPTGEYLEARGGASQHSTLLTPISPNARSSYMTSNTDGSRMSGLSDFPAPPQAIPLANSQSNLAVPPRLTRELSHDTFGRQPDDDYSNVGEAL